MLPGVYACLLPGVYVCLLPGVTYPVMLPGVTYPVMLPGVHASLCAMVTSFHRVSPMVWVILTRSGA